MKRQKSSIYNVKKNSNQYLRNEYIISIQKHGAIRLGLGEDTSNQRIFKLALLQIGKPSKVGVPSSS